MRKIKMRIVQAGHIIKEKSYTINVIKRAIF